MTIAYQTKSAVIIGSRDEDFDIDKPSGTAEGDCLIAEVCLGVAQRTLTGPVGWTKIDEQDQGTADIHLYRKIAGASEPSAYTFNLNNSSKVVGFITRFSGSFPVDPVDVTGGNTSQSSSPTAPTITPTETPTMLYAGFGADDDDATDDTGYPSGYTGIYIRQSTGSGANTGGAAYKSYSGTSATGTAAFSINASEGWGAIHLALYEETGTTHEVSTTITHAQTMSSANVMTTDQAAALAHVQQMSGSTIMTTEQSATLAHAQQFAAFSGLIMDVSSVLALTTQLTTSSEISIDVAVAFALSQALSSVSIMTTEQAVTITHDQALSDSTTMITDQSVAWVLEHVLATAGIMTTDQSATLSHDHQFSSLSGLEADVSAVIAMATQLSAASDITLDVAIAIALTKALSSSVLMQTDQSVSLPITVTAGATGNAIYQGSISFDVDGAIILTAESEGAIDVDATFAMNQTMGASVLADFQENVTLDQVLQLSAQSIATLNNEITIDLSTGLATIGGTVLETSAILSFISSLSSTGSIIQEGAITTPDGRTLKISFDDRTLKISFDDRTLKIQFDDRDLKIH